MAWIIDIQLLLTVKSQYFITVFKVFGNSRDAFALLTFYDVDIQLLLTVKLQYFINCIQSIWQQ